MKYQEISITVPGQVTGPAKLTTYILNQLAVEEDRQRPAIIVCPGGAYCLCSEREHEPIATQFLSMGFHCFVLEYSVEPNRFPTALLELAKTVAMVREHAKEWNVNPEKIYVCGFSAGGHLACSLGTFWNQEMIYGTIDTTADRIRPDGMILCYPVISSGPFAHQGSFQNLLGEKADIQEERDRVSLELQVTPQTPKAFIWHTYEDGAVPVENSLLLAMAMRQNGVNFELHVYPKGPHGLALASEETAGTARPDQNVPACQSWIPLVKTWIKG